MTVQVDHYRGHKIIAVPCKVRGNGWRVENDAGQVLVHHVGMLSLAKGVVDAHFAYRSTPPRREEDSIQK